MIGILITLILVGLLLWVIDQLPIDGTIKRIAHVVLWLINIFLGGTSIDIPVPRLR